MFKSLFFSIALKKFIVLSFASDTRILSREISVSKLLAQSLDTGDGNRMIFFVLAGTFFSLNVCSFVCFLKTNLYFKSFSLFTSPCIEPFTKKTQYTFESLKVK
jgi:hypothetical protein